MIPIKYIDTLLADKTPFKDVGDICYHYQDADNFRIIITVYTHEVILLPVFAYTGSQSPREEIAVARQLISTLSFYQV